MIKTLLATMAVTLALSAFQAGEGHAQERMTLGWGRFFDNDAIGDGHDRWRTGAYTFSQLRGASSWTGVLPQTPGEILEFRMRAETIAPASLVSPDKNDRRYAGALSFGMHTHFGWMGNEVSLGADLVVTGPQTGIGKFQSWVHDQFGLEKPLVLDDQIGNGFYPTLVAELGRPMQMGQVTVRPFGEIRAGAESLVRLGGDMVIGEFGRGDLMLRDPATGQRYRGITGVHDSSFSLVLGGDVAHVFDSVFLPAGGTATLSDYRGRARAGVQWQGERASAFYGVTYLTPEFQEQSEGQFIGSLNLNFKF